MAPFCCALEDIASALRPRGSRYRAKRMEEKDRFFAAHEGVLEDRMWTEVYSEKTLRWCALWRERARYVRGDI